MKTEIGRAAQKALEQWASKERQSAEKADAQKRYQVCLSHAEEIYVATWSSQCKHTRDQAVKDRANCISRGLDRNFCVSTYEVPDATNCPLPRLISTDLKAALEKTRDRCLEESRLGLQSNSSIAKDPSSSERLDGLEEQALRKADIITKACINASMNSIATIVMRLRNGEIGREEADDQLDRLKAVTQNKVLDQLSDVLHQLGKVFSWSDDEDYSEAWQKCGN